MSGPTGSRSTGGGRRPPKGRAAGAATSSAAGAAAAARAGGAPPPRARRPAGPEPPAGQPPVARYRLRYAKRGNARYLSHLDTIKALNRSFRRAGLPVALSGGYNPQPRAAHATALAVGLESECEYVDLDFARPMDALDLAHRLSAALPAGIELRQAQAVRLRGPSLQSYAAVSRYEAQPADASDAKRDMPADLAARIVALESAASVVVSRHGGRQVDIRPYLRSVEVQGGGLVIELGSDARGAARVDELLTLLGLDPNSWRVLKTDFWPLAEGQKLSVWQA